MIPPFKVTQANSPKMAFMQLLKGWLVFQSQKYARILPIDIKKTLLDISVADILLLRIEDLRI